MSPISLDPDEIIPLSFRDSRSGVDRYLMARETLFRIGSTSKAFVSLSILKLVNEGKLSFSTAATFRRRGAPW
jgi:CubicO group peptidase (beta-lactamase class C family)